MLAATAVRQVHIEQQVPRRKAAFFDGLPTKSTRDIDQRVEAAELLADPPRMFFGDAVGAEIDVAEQLRSHASAVVEEGCGRGGSVDRRDLRAGC